MSDETASPSQPPIKITALIGVLAAFALFAAIAGYSSRMTWDYPDYDQQRADARLVTLVTVQKAENALIYPVDPKDPDHHPTAEWIDQAKGTVRIPIEEAMVEEIDTLKARPVQAGGAIAVTAPAAPASTNAAPATPAASTPASTNAAPATPSAPAAGSAAATAQPNPSNK